MTQTHGVEPLSKQTITYLSEYCKTGLDGIEYYPALHSFDLYFNIESLVGPVLRRNDFKIHVQRPTMNTELYNIISELVNMCDDEIHGTNECVLYIDFANKYKVSEAVHEYIANNNIGTLKGIFAQYPGITFSIHANADIKERASTIVSLGYRTFTGRFGGSLPAKVKQWVTDYPTFKLAIDVEYPSKISRVLFESPDGFKDFFQFKYLATLVRLSEPVDFKPETTTKHAIVFDL